MLNPFGKIGDFIQHGEHEIALMFISRQVFLYYQTIDLACSQTPDPACSQTSNLVSSQSSNDVFPKQGLACYCVPNQGIGNENTLDIILACSQTPDLSCSPTPVWEHTWIRNSVSAGFYYSLSHEINVASRGTHACESLMNGLQSCGFITRSKM